MKITVRAIRGMKYRWDLTDFSLEENMGRRQESLATWGMNPDQRSAVQAAKTQAAHIRRAAHHHKVEAKVIEI